MEIRRRSNRGGWFAGEMALLVPIMVPQHSRKSNLTEDKFFSIIPCTAGAIVFNRNCAAGL